MLDRTFSFEAGASGNSYRWAGWDTFGGLTGRGAGTNETGIGSGGGGGSVGNSHSGRVTKTPVNVPCTRIERTSATGIARRGRVSSCGSIRWFHTERL